MKIRLTLLVFQTLLHRNYYGGGPVFVLLLGVKCC